MTSALVTEGELLISTWVASGRQDDAALADGYRALVRALDLEPSAASEVHMATARAAYVLKGSKPSDALRMADLGLRAFALIPDPKRLDHTRAGLLDISRAEALVVQRRLSAALEPLDAVEAGPVSTDERLVNSFITATLTCLRARIDDESLETARAIAGYHSLLSATGRLNRHREQFIEAWLETTLATVSVDRGRVAAEAGAATIDALTVWALAGILGLAFDGLGSRRRSFLVQRLARETANGLPDGMNGRDLGRLVESVARELGGDLARGVVEAVPDPELPVLYAAIARGRKRAGDEDESQAFRALVQGVSKGSPSVSVARALAVYDAVGVGEASAWEGTWADAFARSVGELGRDGASLAEKAEIESSVDYLCYHAFLTWQAGQTMFDRLRLSAVLELARTHTWSSLPTRDEFDRASMGRKGLFTSMDWLGRLRKALRRHRGTAVIISQFIAQREGTLYFCASPLAPDWTWGFQSRGQRDDATFRLAEMAREELEFLLLAGGGENVEFAGACRNAFSELPEVVQDVIRGHRTVIFIPDVRADLQAPPELLHDGEDFVGTSHVVARIATLRDAVRVLEGATSPLIKRRALVAAAPVVEGAPELLHATGEADHVELRLRRADWDVTRLEGDRLEPEFLTRALQHVSVAHLAAHGVDTAGEEAIVLPEGRRLTVEALYRQHYAHLPFVYLNTCVLGAARYLGGGARRGIAHALLELGAPAVIANLLPADDAVASGLAAAFYDEAASHPVGEALRRARERLARSGVPAALWGTFVLVGDPELRIDEAGASPKGPTMLVDRLLDQMARPDIDQSQLEDLAGRALRQLKRDPEDGRLRAAMYLLHVNAEVKTLEGAERAEELQNAVTLAEHLGHPAVIAAARAAQATELLDRGDLRGKDLLEETLSQFDALYELNPEWGDFRLWLYGIYQTAVEFLRTGRNQDFFDDADHQEMILKVLGSHAIAERAWPAARFRAPERSVEDVLWNVTLSGAEARHRTPRARADIGQMLAAKLARRRVLDAQDPYAATVLTGLLPHVWGFLASRLDQHTVACTAECLRDGVEDIRAQWSPPDPSLASDLDGLSTLLRFHLMKVVGLSPSRLARQLWSLGEDLDLWGSVIDRLAGSRPEALPGAYAYMTGAIINASGATDDIEVHNFFNRRLVTIREKARDDGIFDAYRAAPAAEDQIARWLREDGFMLEEPTPIWEAL